MRASMGDLCLEILQENENLKRPGAVVHDKFIVSCMYNVFTWVSSNIH